MKQYSTNPAAKSLNSLAISYLRQRHSTRFLQLSFQVFDGVQIRQRSCVSKRCLRIEPGLLCQFFPSMQSGGRSRCDQDPRPGLPNRFVTVRTIELRPAAEYVRAELSLHLGLGLFDLV